MKGTEKLSKMGRRKSTKVKLPGIDNVLREHPTTTTNSDMEKEKRDKDMSQVNKKKKKKYNRAKSIHSDKHLGHVTPITFPELDKEVSDGSISDREIPKVVKKEKKLCGPGHGADERVTESSSTHPGCAISGVKLTQSKKISCLKSENYPYSTTDYLTETASAFIPSLFHPLNGQVSSAARHKEYIDYLKNSGFFKLFGACVLNVYRMWAWPPPEKLLEAMLNSMGHPVQARIQYNKLIHEKTELHQKVRTLSKQKHEILKALDEYEDSRAPYELLDPEEELLPLAEPPLVNYELMQEIFKNMTLDKDPRDSVSTDPKRVLSASDESAAFSFAFSDSNKSSSRRTDKTPYF